MGTRARVTDEERRRARLHDLERARLERAGIDAATRIGAAAQSAAYRALKARQSPSVAFRRAMQAARPLMGQGMLAAHLTGRQRVLRDMRAAEPVAMSRTAYSGAVAMLRKRLDLDPAQLEAIQRKYEAEAARILKRATDWAERKIEQAFLDVTEQGWHVRNGVKVLAEAFDAAGMAPSNSYTLENIFRTQTQIAYAAGRWNADQAPEVQEILWGYKYVTVGDDRVRPEHAGLEGVTLPKEDQFWAIGYPPNGYSCRCTAISIFDRREVVAPRDEVEIDGRRIVPGPDAGFRVNWGQVFPDSLPWAAV